MPLSISSARVIFTGELVPGRTKGAQFTGRAVPGGTRFDLTLPRGQFSKSCAHCVYAAGCGLPVNDWKFTATVTNPGAVGYPFRFVIGSLARVTGPAPTYFDDWFAGGWAESGTGGNLKQYPILRSTNVAAGALTLTLDRDPDPYWVIGDTVVLYPGCDGRIETCRPYHAVDNPQGKFGNDRPAAGRDGGFQGFPYMPTSNPSAVKLKSSVNGAKK